MRRALAAALVFLAATAAVGRCKWMPVYPGVGVVPDWAGSFGALIQCRMGIDRFTPLRYNNYGCWCGRGHKPLVDRHPDFSVDDIDQACQLHDHCYDAQGLHEGGACDPDQVLTGNWTFDSYRIYCFGGRVAGFRSNHVAGSQADTCARRQYECDTEMVNKIAAHPIPPLFGKPKCPICIHRTSLTTHYRMEPGMQYFMGDRCLQCDEKGEVTDCTACCATAWNGNSCDGRCYEAGFNDTASGGCNTWTGGHSCYMCDPNGKWSAGCTGLCRFCSVSYNGR